MSMSAWTPLTQGLLKLRAICQHSKLPAASNTFAINNTEAALVEDEVGVQDLLHQF
jgi:hypothetical protein